MPTRTLPLRLLLLAGTLLVGEQSGALGQAANGANDQPYWADPNTKLTWAASDNGVGATFMQAKYYCEALTLGGFDDWTLPVIDELQNLFGGPANAGGFHVSGPLKLTGWEWSSSLGKEGGEAWALDFGDGGRASLPMGDSGFNRALCVRRPK